MGRGDWQAIDHGVAKSRTWRKWQHVCVELEELLLSSNSVKQEETTHPANTSKCYKENCLFTEQRIRDKNLMRHCNHKFASDDLQDKSHHPACPRYLRMWMSFKVGVNQGALQKSMSVLSRRRPLILDNKEFAVIAGQGKRVADHEQELKIKTKH